jgi:hypothetical protein
MGFELGFHLNQVWQVEVAPGQALTDRQAIGLAADAGAEAIRYDLNWRDFTRSSSAAFDPDIMQKDANAFARYLVLRGYGEDGGALNSVYRDLREAASRGLRTIVNINTIPDWAKRHPEEPYDGVSSPNPRAFILVDDRRVGEFIHDLVVFCARQTDGQGVDVLKALQGFQIFNEVGGWTQEYNPGYGFYAERQLPYTEYLKLLDHSIALTDKAFRAIGWKGKRPPVLGPNLAGTYTPQFWRAVAAHQPLNPESTAANGKLKLEGISLHPYGIVVRPDVDLDREEAELPEHYGVNDAYARLGTHLTFVRIMQPTDDWLWMLGMIDRDPEKSKLWNLYRYADVPDPARSNEEGKAKNYSADKYYDEGPEMGTERTLAQLNELGLSPLSVHFTEFGASSFVGEGGETAKINAIFADPYRFGFTPANKTLSPALAEELQAEAVLQTLGLFDGWDFLSTATAFTFFDRAEPGFVAQYGLARNSLGKGNKPKWKPAGDVFRAYLANASLSIQTKSKTDGVDLHMLAGKGTLKRRPDRHETVLLRKRGVVFDAGAGDDVVFGSEAADQLTGGDGYDKLYGSAGNDKLDGGAGNDRLKGGAGNDEMIGGPGQDNFVFAAFSQEGSGNAGQDIITDFSPDEDRITFIGLRGDKADLPQWIADTEQGALLTWAENGATVLLRGVKKSQLSGRHFHVPK